VSVACNLFGKSAKRQKNRSKPYTNGVYRHLEQEQHRGKGVPVFNFREDEKIVELSGFKPSAPTIVN